MCNETDSHVSVTGISQGYVAVSHEIAEVTPMSGIICLHLFRKRVQSNAVKPHQFKRHLFYSVKYSVVPFNSSLVTITLQSSVKTTLVYNDTRYSVPFMML
jgi:hypothetical protein